MVGTRYTLGKGVHHALCVVIVGVTHGCIGRNLCCLQGCVFTTHVAERHRVDRLILTDGVDRPGSGTDV